MTKDEVIEKVRSLSPEAASAVLDAYRSGDPSFECKASVAVELQGAGIAVLHPEEVSFRELVAERKRRRSAKESVVFGLISGAFGGVSFMWIVGVPFSWIPASAIAGTLAVTSVFLYFFIVRLNRWADKKQHDEEVLRKFAETFKENS